MKTPENNTSQRSTLLMVAGVVSAAALIVVKALAFDWASKKLRRRISKR